MKKNISPIFGFTVVLFLLVFLSDGFTVRKVAAETDQKDVQQVTLNIDGMDCSACAKDIRSALLEVPGVKAAEVKVAKKWFFWSDFSDARAIVEFEQGKTTADELIKAIEGASNSMFTYQARLIE